MAIRFVVCSLMVLISWYSGLGVPVGTAFTYQGQLKESGVPANGPYDFEFRLFDLAASGVQQGPVVSKSDVLVENGLITTNLDFGDVFDGNRRWLEVRVRDGSSSGAFTLFTPRQELTATPYAMSAPGGPVGSGPWQVSGSNISNTNTGNVGIGASPPSTKLDVRGNLTLDPGANPEIFTGTGATELNRYLLLLNSAQLQSASGLKAGGLLISDNYQFANPGKSDLIVKGNVGIGTASPARRLHVMDTGPFTARYESSNTTAAVAEFRNSNSNATWEYAVAGSGLPFGLPAGSMYLYKQGEAFPNLSLHANGIVGMGTNAPNTATRLNVVTGGVGYQAVRGDAPNGNGVVGTSATAGNGAVAGINSAGSGIGVYGEANVGGSAYGVWGRSNQGAGVYGFGQNGVVAVSNGLGYAIHATGDVRIVGNFYASGTKDFRIDHPRDPGNKYLHHHAAEGPEPLNIYRGTVRLEADGEAEVNLPDYFEDINKDFTYVLTAVGTAMPNLHVANEIEGNRFGIAGGSPSGKVCWEVKGMRNNLYVRAHGAPVEVEKPEYERGKYQHPELYGKSKEMAIHYQPHPEEVEASSEMEATNATNEATHQDGD